MKVRAAFVLLFSFWSAHADAGPRLTLEFLGEAQIPSGTEFEGTVVGGLSGIDYNPVTGSFVAISDDRSSPRYYDLNIDLSDGVLSSEDVDITAVTTLLNDDNEPFDNRPDPEGIRVLPFPGLLYWTSERVDGDTTPFARVATLSGEFLGQFDLPEKFVSVPDVAGTRNNLGFESLTFGSNKESLIVANESALVQDGAPASLEAGSPVRVLKYSTFTGQPQQEYIYNVDAIAAAPEPADGFADSGLVELLSLNRFFLLAMERSFSVGPAGYTIKLYLTTTIAASNVSGLDSIEGRRIRAMPKRLLLDLDELGITLDNVEGMTLGPRVHGARTLILVSDDNFSAFGPQVTQILAFKIHAPW